MIYGFENCRLDTVNYRLERSGETVSVEPLVFDLLLYLIERRERVVSRRELLDNLWRGKVVTDAALGARLKDARKAVGDSGDRQAVIKTVHGRGYRFVADVSVSATASGQPAGPAGRGDEIGRDAMGPVRYCRSPDGVNIAHAEVGQGPPVVLTASWMSHLEEDWNNAAWGPYLSQLARSFRLVRYDQRGNGMSDWDGVDIAFDKMVDDLCTVIDQYDYEQVALFGPSQAASVAIAFAQRYPGRVSRLVLYGGYARGRRRRGNPEDFAESEALVTLIRQSWGNDNPAIRQAYTSLLMPDASAEEMNWFNEFQKTCGPAENIARFREMFDDMDVTGLLAQISTPTLVIHSARESAAPLAEGKLLASSIPGAKFVTLNSRNHMVFPHEPEFPRLIRVVTEFLMQS